MLREKLNVSNKGFLKFVKDALSFKQAKLASLTAMFTFMLLYALGIGIVFRSPTPLPREVQTPTFDLITEGPIGQVPWFIAYLDRYWIVSISLEAGLAMLALGTLVGLNFGVMVYLKGHKSCKLKPKGTVLSAMPSFFCVFACCGGGLVTTILFTVGVGGLATGMLLPYGRILAFLSSLALVVNLYVTYRKGVKR